MPKTDQIRRVTPDRLGRLTAAANRKPRIALMGEFSSGKSTLLNLLIGETLLPTKVTATELPPVWFSHGGPRSWWVDQDGHEHRMDFGSFAGIPRSARYVRVFTPSPMLERCDILDTPGISDPNLEEDSWRFAVGQASFVLWCTSSTQAWRETERSTWAALPERLRANSVLVVTRSDKLGPEDREKVRRRLTRESFGLFGGLVFISTLDAMRGLEALTRGTGSAQWDSSGGAELDARIEAGLESVRAERLDLLERYTTGEPPAPREPAPVVVLPRAVAFAESSEPYEAVRPRRVELSEVRRTERPAAEDESDPLSAMRAGWNALRPEPEERPAPVLRLADPIRPPSHPGWVEPIDHDQPLLLDAAWAAPADEMAPRLDAPDLRNLPEDDAPAIMPRAVASGPSHEPLVLTGALTPAGDHPAAPILSLAEPALDKQPVTDDAARGDAAEPEASDDAPTTRMAENMPMAAEAVATDDLTADEPTAVEPEPTDDPVAIHEDEPAAVTTEAEQPRDDGSESWIGLRHDDVAQPRDEEVVAAEASAADAVDGAEGDGRRADDAYADPHHEPDLAMDTVFAAATEEADAPLLDLSTLAAEFEAAEDDPLWDLPAEDEAAVPQEPMAAVAEAQDHAPDEPLAEAHGLAAPTEEPVTPPETAAIAEEEPAEPVATAPEDSGLAVLAIAPEPHEERPAALRPVESAPVAAEGELPRAVRIWRDIVARSPEIPSNGPIVAMIDQLLCELSRDDELSDGIAANPATIVGQTRAA